MIVQAHADSTMLVCSVWFGNVLGSRGSLLAAIARQVEQGEPVTVTDPEVTRYFMAVEEAVGMVLSAASMATSGETFVLDMGEPVRIVDLVRRYAPSNSVSRMFRQPHRLASGRETAREAIQQEGGARAHR